MKRIWKVVDLFSGCGGLGLGFELLDDPSPFHTVMALDNHAPSVRCFNHNHRKLRPELKGDPGKVVDLTWFNNETEIRLFYLAHLSSVSGEKRLARSLDSDVGLPRFLSQIAALDQQYISQLTALRSTEDFRVAGARVTSGVSSLAITKRFFRRLELPNGWGRKPEIPSLLWMSNGDGPVASGQPPRIEPSPEIRDALKNLWKSEVESLRNATSSVGRGQHATVAKKVQTVVDFFEGSVGRQVFEIWLNWRSARDTVREEFFTEKQIQDAAWSLYNQGRKVDVLLGGPPCKGISRIGRAKIASLRDQGVHGWINREYGDDRNLLFLKYVIFLHAFMPDVFVFENVRHFTAALKTEQAEFDPVRALEDAIAATCSEGGSYATATNILRANESGCPQMRERFFLVGTRREVATDDTDNRNAKAILQVKQSKPELPLLSALVGIANPGVFRFAGGGGVKLGHRVSAYDCILRHLGKVACDYVAWIRRAPSTISRSQLQEIDGHVYREVRNDDARLVELFGPGKRWMDYTVNQSNTLAELRELLQKLEKQLGEQSKQNGTAELAELSSSLKRKLRNKSLVLRLMMEEMNDSQPDLFGTGGPHHLLNATYLSKGPDNHGDWFERLDPTKPSKTIVAHMARDTYSFFHPWEPRPLTVREAARLQTFPDWFDFGMLGMCDAYETVGNAVPPLLSSKIAANVLEFLLTGGNSPVKKARKNQSQVRPKQLAKR